MSRPNHLSRRRFLGLSAASLTALGLGNMPPFLRRAAAGPLGQGKKLLFVFLRGGIDAVQAVIPYGDAGLPARSIPSYLDARPTIGVQPANAHDLNGFASLFPSMQVNAEADGPKLADIFHNRVDGRGQNLAVIHRVGYANQNRSHFSSQQFWENGVPGDTLLEEGVFNRYLTEYRDPSAALQAVTVNPNQMVILKGPTVVPALRTINDYALPANVALGVRPSPDNPRGKGLLGAYAQPGFPQRPYEAQTYATGATLLDSLVFFENEVRQSPYQPEADAQPFYASIANRGFASAVQDCARLLKQVGELQIVGCNQDGYDTHGSEDQRFPPLVGDLSLALTALYHDLKSIWKDVVVMTMSEFGRTPIENGNRGTDHGESTCVFAMGGPVRGGVYNCDASTWANGDLLSSASGRYTAHRTDFRAVYQEILSGHLGDPAARMDTIIPGWSALLANDPAGHFAPLGFITPSSA